MSFSSPVRCITTPRDLEQFQSSTTYREYLNFVKALSQSVKGKKVSDDYVRSELVESIVELLKTLSTWTEEIPPIDQPMRFGNKAYRTWYDRLHERMEELHKKLLPEDVHPAIVELAGYFQESFGNRTRIDYGTGHETSFMIWLYCLFRLKMFKEEDFTAIVLVVFNEYLQFMRKIQLLYMLEPAGSHGVWGLDDYQCLVFYFGSSQLIRHSMIQPESIHDQEILTTNADEYLYLRAIEFIRQVKSGSPFAETSPMLNDISGVESWTKVNSGMMKLYQGEVLNKLPVIQHVVFGSLFPCTWTPSPPSAVPATAPSCHFPATHQLP